MCKTVKLRWSYPLTYVTCLFEPKPGYFLKPNLHAKSFNYLDTAPVRTIASYEIVLPSKTTFHPFVLLSDETTRFSIGLEIN